MIRFCLTLLIVLIAAPHVYGASPGAGETRKPNRLVSEASPYLRQHAYNPVDWYPWGKDAFERARKENKPIFLSVGYSTCHWCHVMQRESFENDEIARVINASFVAIKVDRERRPDVDETYMLATQLTAQHSGWPNNVFMTPDLKPFYGGTYFPPDQFMSTLREIAGSWSSEPDALKKDADNLANAIDTAMTRRIAAAEITPEKLKNAAAEILKDLDEFNGGFSKTLKFPQEPVLLFLLRQAEKHGNIDALAAVSLTLDNLLIGGIHDHAGGGFHRYAVDPQWQIPHFEKMLYNQALMSQVLVRAYRITGKARYARAARRALNYVLRDLTAPHGGFYSARDAESGGHEGAFYVWRPEQIKQVLSPEDADFAIMVMGVSALGNFEGQTTVLHLIKSPEEWAAELKISEAQFTARFDRILDSLAKARASREEPFRDEKTVTAWNGLMIAAFAEAAEALGDRRFGKAAENAANFAWNKLWDGEGLNRVWFEGKASLQGQQEDYAFTALGFVAVYDITGDPVWLERAETLTDAMVAKFRDAKAGDYFMTASINTFSKAKARTDASMPSGNAVALDLLARLASRSRLPDHRLRGEALLAALSGISLRNPKSSAYALMAADLLLHGGVGPRRFMAKGTVDAKSKLDEDGRLSVHLRIAPGWHINADKPLEEFFIPTKLAVKGAEGARIVYPKALRRKLGFHDKELALYEGEVALSVELRPDQPLPVNAELQLQACSDQICLEPETATLTVHGRAASPPRR